MPAISGAIMGLVRGQKEFAKFKRGERLTRKEAILALCYDCNGQEDSRHDCGCTECPLYQYRPYKKERKHVKKPTSGAQNRLNDRNEGD